MREAPACISISVSDFHRVRLVSLEYCSVPWLTVFGCEIINFSFVGSTERHWMTLHSLNNKYMSTGLLMCLMDLVAPKLLTISTSFWHLLTHMYVMYSVHSSLLNTCVLIVVISICFLNLTKKPKGVSVEASGQTPVVSTITAIWSTCIQTLH